MNSNVHEELDYAPQGFMQSYLIAVLPLNTARFQVMSECPGIQCRPTRQYVRATHELQSVRRSRHNLRYKCHVRPHQAQEGVVQRERRRQKSRRMCRLPKFDGLLNPNFDERKMVSPGNGGVVGLHPLQPSVCPHSSDLSPSLLKWILGREGVLSGLKRAHPLKFE